ncbi:cell wall protein Ecm33 [Elasticomyces elasticus]|nr:cell wall protein Ecm33 [Elasticomyces elasticus]KAK3624180.1 cell wall protein Ecm33 [Elasticomyces elasticus]KAK4906386.1 cell wall protein Ecm33 [Elasticomyces elasticus]KAK5744651.1 cell wall protein Ecm33 [Elasticomyces elasticus]
MAKAQCSNTTTTIRNAVDATSLASCKTFTGVISIATDSPAVIELNGVETIVGDLVVANNSVLTTIASNSLATVSDQVVLANLTNLANLTFPAVENITSPNIVDLSSILQQVDNVYILNTQIQDLSPLSLQSPQLQTLQIIGNYYLTKAYFKVGNITQSATIANNSGSTTVVLPSLAYAYDLTIANASNLEIPMLQSISRNLEISYSQIQNLRIPNLTYIGGDLSITNNLELTELHLDDLVDIQGTLSVEINPSLSDLSGLSSLSNVGGSLELQGGFSNLSLSALRVVQGNADLNTTGTATCQDIPPALIVGRYTCNEVERGNGATSGGTSMSTANKSALSAAAIAGIVVGVVVLFALAAITGYFWTRMKHRRVTETTVGVDNMSHEIGQDHRWISDDLRSYEMDTPILEIGTVDTKHRHSGPEYLHEPQGTDAHELDVETFHEKH